MEEGAAAASATGSDSAPTGDIPYIRSDNWERECMSKSLCAIGFLDGYEGSESDGLAKSLSVLQGARAKSAKKKEPFTFMWTDGICQESFADAFDVQPLKVPTVVVYAPKKGRYASFVGALSDEALTDFLAGVLSGRIGTKPMSNPPLPSDIDCKSFNR